VLIFSTTHLVLRIPLDYSVNETQIVSSSAGCLTPFGEVSGLIEGDCHTVNVQQHFNTSNIWVTISLDDSNCDSATTVEWAIPVTATLVILFVLSVAFCFMAAKNRTMRKFFFPYRDRKKYSDHSMDSLEDNNYEM